MLGGGRGIFIFLFQEIKCKSNVVNWLGFLKRVITSIKDRNAQGGTHYDYIECYFFRRFFFYFTFSLSDGSLCPTSLFLSLFISPIFSSVLFFFWSTSRSQHWLGKEQPSSLFLFMLLEETAGRSDPRQLYLYHVLINRESQTSK